MQMNGMSPNASYKAQLFVTGIDIELMLIITLIYDRSLIVNWTKYRFQFKRPFVIS